MLNNHIFQDVRALAINHLAAQMAASQDDVIAKAITADIGPGWSPASLAGRLTRTVYPDGVEIFAIDQRNILELHPSQFEHTATAGTGKITATQRYRNLPC